MSARTHAGPRPEQAAPRPLSRANDPEERQAELAADVVARGGSVAGWSFASVAPTARVQRQQAGKPKSEEEKQAEALRKAGEAALATPEGKALKEKVLQDPLVKRVTEAATSPAGLAVAGTALAGGVAALAATGRELPVQPPAVPLERLSPKLAGVTARLAYEGPVNRPTFVGLTITVKEQGSKGRGGKPDPVAADIARLRAQEELFRRGRTYAPGSKEAEEERLLDEAIQKFVLRGTTLPGLTIPLTPPPAREEEEQAPAQPAPAGPSAAPPASAHVDAALHGPGRPLDPPARRELEARFGRDFSRVRIHDDARAAATAASIDAAAFTVGERIAFAAGRYDPSAPDGGRLLAHELAHVVQQSGADGSRAGAVPAGPGRPLGAELRGYFEPRLGVGLGEVRIHDGPGAAAAAGRRRARAYTVGPHVVFGRGQYEPETPRGRWLLGHELAHVAQARQGVGGDAAAAVERDAGDAATEVSRGRRARVRGRRDAGAVQLFGEPDRLPDLTFVSTSGGQGFLDQAVQYHTSWGLAPRRFSSMQQLLSTLAQDRGTIARLRIVSHADFDNIFAPLFEGGSAGISEEDLLAFGESDVAGLRHALGRPLVTTPQLRGQVLDALRASNPAALRPFGLDQPGTAPAGAVERLVGAGIELLGVRTATGGITQAQRATLEAALTAELAGLRAEVQQAPPAGAGVTADEAQALETAITTVAGFVFQLPAQPADRIAAVARATAGLGQGFRSNLEAVRARLPSSSWIDLRGCRVGQRPAYLQAVSTFFGTTAGRPSVSGPEWYQSYPTLGYQVVADAQIRARARDRDVLSALDHWAEVTGIRERLSWWLSLLGGVLRQETLRTTAPDPSALRPPALGGGLRLQLDPILHPLAAPGPLATMPLPEFGLPERRPRGPSFGAATLQNPLLELAQRDIPRYTAPDGLLRYYLDAGLPLPVQRARNVQDIRLLLKAGRERDAVDAWLASQWEPAAPGLSALRAGAWQRDELRQVEAVSDLNQRRRTVSMYVSPDPRYDQRIKKT